MIVGVDIGTAGALALLTPDGDLVEVADMPVLRDGPKGRPTVNAPLLAALVYRWHAKQAFVEYVGARPGEGAVGAFAFGRSRGVVEGVLAACGVPATLPNAGLVETSCRAFQRFQRRRA
jgi:crossover junction endodeoxyribonuclease RuvC